ncbi:MAG: hypothetical protein ACSHX8_06640 [Opitutaceae bacterium]
MRNSLKQCFNLALLFCGSALLPADTQIDTEFFPGLDDQSDETIHLHGLASLYPGTILFKTPELLTRSQRQEAAKVEDLPNKIAYVRIYRLEEAISAIRKTVDTPALILDLRYLQAESLGAELASLLSSEPRIESLTAIGKVPASIEEALGELSISATKRTYPAIVLCNRETAGPFEAILHILQKNGSIIGVGEATAGRTGFYKKAKDQIWVIEGELRPTQNTSLINTGFVPRIEIDATPESNYMSYHIYEAGTPISRVLRKENLLATDDTEDSTEDADAEKFEPDHVLQRGVDIVAALQVLQQLPESD